MSILSAQNLTYSVGVEIILEDINFNINKGDRVGVVGVNGAGKSTLLKLLVGEYTPDEGEISMTKGTTLGYLKQREHFEPGQTVLEVMENVPEDVKKAFEESHGYDYQRAITGFLTAMSFTEDYYNRDTSLLSGGEKTRLALCALLVREPDILLLDEPTNHLDLPTLAWLENYLKSYKGTLIIVSHDRYFLDRSVNKIFEIENCHMTCYNGNYSEYKIQKQRNYEIDLKHYLHEMEEIKRQEELITRWKGRGTEHLTKRARSREKRLAHIVPPTKPTQLTESLRVNFSEKLMSGNDVVTASNLSFGYGGNNQLFKNVDLDIKKGDRICIVGENGVGKTTLLKLLLGRLMPNEGRIILGTNVMPGYYDQEQTSLHPSSTVLDEIHSSYIKYDETDIRKILGSFLFHGDDVFKRVSDLAGGEKARLCLLKLMMSGSNLLIFDEPTNHLDISAKEIFEEAISNFPGTVIIVSHDRYLLQKLPTAILELTKDGMVKYLGNFDYYSEKKKEKTKAERAGAVKKEPSLESVENMDPALGKNTPSESTRKSESYEEKKAREKEERKIKKQQGAAEELVMQLEDKIKRKESELDDPAVAADAAKLSEIALELSDLRVKLSKAMDDWINLME